MVKVFGLEGFLAIYRASPSMVLAAVTHNHLRTALINLKKFFQDLVFRKFKRCHSSVAYVFFISLLPNLEFVRYSSIFDLVDNFTSVTLHVVYNSPFFRLFFNFGVRFFGNFYAHITLI